MKTVEKIKYFIKKFPIIYKITLSFKKKLVVFLRIKDVAIMMITFHILPQYIYKFSTRKLLPPKKNRYSAKEQLIPPYSILKSQTSEIPKMKEIDLIVPGSSYNLNLLKKIKKPTFLISLWDSLKIDENQNIIYVPPFHPSYRLNNPETEEISKKKNLKEFRNDNLTYVHNYTPVLDSISEKGHNCLCLQVYHTGLNGEVYPLSKEIYDKPVSTKYETYEQFLKEKKFNRIFIVEKLSRFPIAPPYSNWAATCSFIPSFSGLFFFAEKINVYGWDFYLTSSPKTMSQLQLYLKMYDWRRDAISSNMIFEGALVNFYYGYKLSKLPNVKIYGYMGDLEKHEKLIKKIEKVLFL